MNLLWQEAVYKELQSLSAKKDFVWSLDLNPTYKAVIYAAEKQHCWEICNFIWVLLAPACYPSY